MARRPLIAGNWKMHGRPQDVSWPQAFAAASSGAHAAELVVCPPFPLIPLLSEGLKAAGLAVGAQDCSAEADGAFTGEVSAALLAGLGCRHVIVGHSERRRRHAESDGLVRRKAEAARAAGMTPIVCVGEDADARDEGRAQAVVLEQLARSLPGEGPVVIAYEPVWAIGTGRAASVEDAAAMHAAIRGALPEALAGTPLLYGGSVKPDVAAGLLAADGVDGLLVGGASLDPAAFASIAAAAR